MCERLNPCLAVIKDIVGAQEWLTWVFAEVLAVIGTGRVILARQCYVLLITIACVACTLFVWIQQFFCPVNM